MSRYQHVGAVVVAFSILTANLVELRGADTPTQEWLRSSGSDLQICLKGEVFELNNEAITDLKITGGLNTYGSQRALEPTIRGNRFEMWIPVNEVRWYSMWLKAESVKGERVAYKKLSTYELRQVAIDGIKLTLQSPTRHVNVKVVENGQPVVGAVVKADQGYGIESQVRTNSDGIARIDLVPGQRLYGLMAWTDDYRIGGFVYYRTPQRDPDAAEQVVELTKCRNQKIRFVDEKEAPVRDVEFLLHVATPEPHFNFLGTNEHSTMMTDAAGEVVYPWFPDWEGHFFYGESKTNKWVIDREHVIVDDVAVFKLKRAQDRKQVQGSVVSRAGQVGGFHVTLRSNTSNIATAFSDANGNFSLDVLPDATYCAYVHDSQWVGEIVDLLPYQAATGQFTSPKLLVAEGQEVEIIVTSGPQKKPYPNLNVSLRREYKYTWREDGRTRRGVGGPQWSVTTDASGRATTRTLPGKLKASVDTPLWRTEESIDVNAGAPITIKLHREVDEPRTVKGRLVLAEGIESNLADAEIQIGCFDGNHDDRQTLKASKDGSFSFSTYAVTIGIYGHTQDGKAAGALVVKDLESPIQLVLRPTMDYHGQLLGEKDRPLVGHGVRATVLVEGDKRGRSAFSKRLNAKHVDTITDDQGNFTLHGVPCEVKVVMDANSPKRSSYSDYLGEIYMEPNESRPRAVSRLGTPLTSAATETSLVERYKKTLRDSLLCGFHVMVIVPGNGEKLAGFVNQNFVDYEANKDVYSFMQIVVSGTPAAIKEADAKFLQGRGWEIPDANGVFVCALDAKGNELGRVSINVLDKGAAEQAVNFVRENAVAQVDAEKKWQSAFDEASRTNRRVLARVSQRYCGPCFRMARWLDDHHQLLEKDYVMLKIDDVRDENGIQVSERLTRGESYGIPFYAIFDHNKMMLVDSAGPLGNIGHPSDFDGKKHLRKMLLTTRQKLTDAEVEQLVASLGE